MFPVLLGAGAGASAVTYLRKFFGSKKSSSNDSVELSRLANVEKSIKEQIAKYESNSNAQTLVQVLCEAANDEHRKLLDRQNELEIQYQKSESLLNFSQTAAISAAEKCRQEKLLLIQQQKMLEEFMDNLKRFQLDLTNNSHIIENIEEESENARKKLKMSNAKPSVAFVGHVKVGKSTLINNLIRKRHYDCGAAKTDLVECEHDVIPIKYEWEDKVLYDIRGMASLNSSAAGFFEDKKLFIFDCLVLLLPHTLSSEECYIIREVLKYANRLDQEIQLIFVKTRMTFSLRRLKTNRKIARNLTEQEQANKAVEIYKKQYMECLQTDVPEIATLLGTKIKLFFIESTSLYPKEGVVQPKFEEEAFLEELRKVSKKVTI